MNTPYIYIKAEVPENCFRCFASRFENYGVVAGFRCNLLWTEGLVSNCEGRSKRRENCPIVRVDSTP